jgi:ferredoxin
METAFEGRRREIFAKRSDQAGAGVPGNDFTTGRRNFVAYHIDEECISCGACESECIVNCISAGDSKYVIDEEACVECGACAEVCPVGAPKVK